MAVVDIESREDGVEGCSTPSLVIWMRCRCSWLHKGKGWGRCTLGRRGIRDRGSFGSPWFGFEVRTLMLTDEVGEYYSLGGVTPASVCSQLIAVAYTSDLRAVSTSFLRTG